MRAASTAAVGLVALLAVGCSTGSGPTPERPAGASPAAAEPAATAAPEPPRPVTLAFAGDVHFERRVRERLDGAEPALGPVSPVLAAADLAMVNLESAVTEGGRPEPKTYTFRAPASALDALAASGVDVVSLANNHAVDFGRAGLDDTLAAVAASPVPAVGLGADAASAYAPHVLDVRGTEVAVLAASQVRDNTLQRWSADADSPGIAAADDPRLLSAVAAAAERADVVVVYLHWGREREGCPSDAQERLADDLAQAGADVVVGTHAHRLQGAGWHDSGAYVAYGLGNFLWYSSNSRTADTTGVLTLTVGPDGTVTAAELTPALIDGRGVPVPREGAERAQAVEAFEALRECTGLSAVPPGPRPGPGGTPSG